MQAVDNNSDVSIPFGYVCGNVNIKDIETLSTNQTILILIDNASLVDSLSISGIIANSLDNSVIQLLNGWGNYGFIIRNAISNDNNLTNNILIEDCIINASISTNATAASFIGYSYLPNAPLHLTIRDCIVNGNIYTTGSSAGIIWGNASYMDSSSGIYEAMIKIGSTIDISNIVCESTILSSDASKTNLFAGTSDFGLNVKYQGIVSARFGQTPNINTKEYILYSNDSKLYLSNDSNHDYNYKLGFHFTSIYWSENKGGGVANQMKAVIDLDDILSSNVDASFEKISEVHVYKASDYHDTNLNYIYKSNGYKLAVVVNNNKIDIVFEENNDIANIDDSVSLRIYSFGSNGEMISSGEYKF